MAFTLNPLAMWQVVVAGIAVHFILFYSIFDIYFTSPLVHGMTPQSAPTKPLAKRLVLFVADGLRADKFFELDKNGQSRAPYLRSVIETHGAWGVSHTRMPTESRPGHVAMIAGFYEDVSAVAKGWKENPVEFDSVFNETRHTWSWGSPDILPMFAKGAKRGHVNMDCYPGEEEDFASTMSSNLDTWVFDRFKTFLSSAQDNRTLNDMLNEDRIVMFLHLLGIDVNGHSHKPHSQEYLENIRIVDQGIYEVVKLMDDFYQDSKTAYVMTSDHGMTNWGSHGAGDPHETLTPLVVWGSGIRGAQRHHHLSDHPFEDASQDWNLQHVKRVDIEQADIAPLMACLIGITFPLNSVGTLPLDYLDATDSYKADNLLTNAYQILSQFQIKMEEKRETSLSYFFRPYTPLTASKQAGYLREIRHLMQTMEYSQAIDQTSHLIKLGLRGLTYYHTYDRFLLGVSIALSFLGWITYTLCFVLSRYSSFTTARTKSDRLSTPAWRADSTIKIAFGTLCSVVVFIMYVQRSPVTHVVYVVLPVVLWGLVSLSFSPVSQVMSHIYKSGQAINTLFIIGAFLCGLELLVQSFFHRWCLSLGLVSMGFIIGFSNTHRLDKTTLFCWIGGCLILAVFPLLPVVGGQTNHNLVVFSGGVICVGGLLILFRTKAHKSARLVHFIQIVAVALTSYIVKSTSLSIADKSGVPWLNQITSWVILATSLVIPLFSSTGVVERLFSLTMSLCAPYLLLSMAHEGLFLISLCFVLFLWLYIEHSLTDSPNRITELVFTSEHHPSNERNHVTVSDLKISYFILLLILTAFFGTGNIASINSFDPTSVYCFLTVFSPFTMGALMMWKNVIPFLLVTCTFHAVHVSTRLPTIAFFSLVLIMSDLMAFNFFFLIRDTGSWLDIGTSISHYVIVMTMILFFMLLHGGTYVVTRLSLPRPRRSKQHEY